jgi:hypothetical protein
VHCSIWRFEGDPEALERGYRELIGGIPASNHMLHLAARTPDGLLIVDTCPSEEAYRSFFGSDDVRALFERHGLALDGARVEDHPVVLAFARRAPLDAERWNS